MDGQINILTLLSLIVLVIVVFKLRSVLGRRTPDDEARIDRNMRAQQAAEQAAATKDKVVTMPRPSHVASSMMTSNESESP